MRVERRSVAEPAMIRQGQLCATAVVLAICLLLHAPPAGSQSRAADDGGSCSISRTAASRALGDVIANFWVGTTSRGHIVNTWNGYTDARKPLPDPRGSLWERAMLYNALFQEQKRSKSILSLRRLKADWSYVKSAFSTAELGACGNKSKANFALDDTGWNALYFIQAYRTSNDQAALGMARAAVFCALDRWIDPAAPGGLWYSDDRKAKALYEVSIVKALMDLAEIDGRNEDFVRAFQLYEWLESNMLREDGLYWVERDTKGPRGSRTPEEIRPTSSVTFLGGNMEMAALHARLYRRTGEDVYRRRALRTAAAVTRRLVDGNRVFINDRDAWVNGYFFPDWVEWVMPLYAQDGDALTSTAASISQRARTQDGFYGGDWSGPDLSGKLAWKLRGTLPQQIMTSASAATVIMAAAAYCSR